MSTKDLLSTTSPTMSSWKSTTTSAQNLSKNNVVAAISAKEVAAFKKDAKISWHTGRKSISKWNNKTSLGYHILQICKSAQDVSTTELGKAVFAYMSSVCNTSNGRSISLWKQKDKTKLKLNDLEILKVVKTRKRPNETVKEREISQCNDTVRTRESNIRQSILFVEEKQSNLKLYDPVEDDVPTMEHEKNVKEEELDTLEKQATARFIFIQGKLNGLNKQKICVHLCTRDWFPTKRNCFLRMKYMLISKRINELLVEESEINRHLNQDAHYINELTKKIKEGMTFDELEKKTKEENYANKDAIIKATETSIRLTEEIEYEKMYNMLNDDQEDTIRSYEDSEWNDIVSNVLNSETEASYRTNSITMMKEVKERVLDGSTLAQRFITGTAPCVANKLFTIPERTPITFEVLRRLNENIKYINQLSQFLVKLIGETYLKDIGLDPTSDELKEVKDNGLFGILNYITQMANQSKSTFDQYESDYNMMANTLNKDLKFNIMNEKKTEFLSPNILDKKHKRNVRTIKDSLQGRSGNSESPQTIQEIAALTKPYEEDVVQLIVSTMLRHPSCGTEVKNRLLEEQEKLKNELSHVNSIKVKPFVGIDFAIDLLKKTIETTTEEDMKSWIRASKHFKPISFLKQSIKNKNEINVMDSSRNKNETKINDVMKTKVGAELQKQLNETQAQINSAVNHLDVELNKKTINMPGNKKAIKLEDVEKQIMSFTKTLTSSLDAKYGKNKNGNSKRQGHNDQLTKVNSTCYEFRKNGKCGYGDKCRFKHIDSGKKVFKRSKPGTRIRSKMKCIYFHQYGKCKNGDECYYSH